MNFLIGALVLVAAILLLRGFVSASPAQVAKAVRLAPAGALGLASIVAALTGRAGLASLLFGAAGALYARAHQRSGGVVQPESSGSSVVRTALIEMSLDHDTGDMDGMMLSGPHEGAPFSMMDESVLGEVLREVSADADSRSLLETYLDRKAPGWRERFDARPGDRQGAAPGTGAMTEEEAYQILGLAPGSGPELVRKAHRRLMQRVHPDLGGTDFLAARINAAKDLLLSVHRKT
jgi:hypothetical protein